MSVREVVEGHHTKRTKGFLSACIAYGFITIPTLENILTQLQLYLIVGQVAYANQCLSQGELINSLPINHSRLSTERAVSF